jgi:hypothetical protein
VRCQLGDAVCDLGGPGSGVLTAVHGADDAAIDGAHVPVVFVGIVAGCSSTCRDPARIGAVRRGAAGQCCRAASAPRRCAPAVRVGLPSDTWGPVRQAAHNVVVTVTAPIGMLGTGSYPQFVAMVSDATSASGVALNIPAPRRRCSADRPWDAQVPNAIPAS